MCLPVQKEYGRRKERLRHIVWASVFPFVKWRNRSGRDFYRPHNPPCIVQTESDLLEACIMSVKQNQVQVGEMLSHPMAILQKLYCRCHPQLGPKTLEMESSSFTPGGQREPSPLCLQEDPISVCIATTSCCAFPPYRRRNHNTALLDGRRRSTAVLYLWHGFSEHLWDSWVLG